MSRTALFTLLLLCLVPGHALAQAQIQLLDAGDVSLPVSLSADGSTIAWTGRAGSRATLSSHHIPSGVTREYLSGCCNAPSTPAINSDGSIIAGSYFSGGSSRTSYTISNGVLAAGPSTLQFDRAISDDGRVRVGQTGTVASRTDDGVATILADPPGGGTISVARAITPDGSVIAGTAAGSFGAQAAVWQNGNVRLLQPRFGSGSGSGVTAMTDDGRTLVGFENGDFQPQAVYWTRFGVFGPFVIPSPGTTALTDMQATDIGSTPEGNLIVGTGFSGSTEIPWIWDAEGGTRELSVFLESMGIDTRSTQLTSALISRDGRTLAGAGQNASGPVVWYAVIPEPGTALLVGLGLAGLAARRDRA